jgi:predicted dehydrogenase
MNDIRWGILATGGIAKKFATDLKATGRPIVAVGSRSQEKADRFAADFGIAKAHASYEALAADPNVDAIYVATPHPFHASAARIAIAAGKHVLIEKPFTLNAPEAQEIVDLAAARKVVILEAMWTRFLPHMIRLREVIASGMIGEVRALVATHTQDLPDDPKHRLNDPNLGGGALLDLGIYPVSFAFDLLGEPVSIQASGRLKETGVDAEVTTIFRHGNGATSLLLCTSDAAGPNTAQISGSDGYIEIDGVWYTPTSFRVFDSSKTLVEEYRSDVPGRGMQYQAAELERLVASGDLESTIMAPSQSVAIMHALDDIRAQIGVRYPGEGH